MKRNILFLAILILVLFSGVNLQAQRSASRVKMTHEFLPYFGPSSELIVSGAYARVRLWTPTGIADERDAPSTGGWITIRQLFVAGDLFWELGQPLWLEVVSPAASPATAVLRSSVGIYTKATTLVSGLIKPEKGEPVLVTNVSTQRLTFEFPEGLYGGMFKGPIFLEPGGAFEVSWPTSVFFRGEVLVSPLRTQGYHPWRHGQ